MKSCTSSPNPEKKREQVIPVAGNQEEHVKTQDREVKKAYDAWMSAPSDKKSQALSKLNEERGKLNSKYSAYTSAMTGQPKIKTLSEIIGHSPY